MSEKLRSTTELECERKIQILQENIKQAQAEIANIQVSVACAATERILGMFPFGNAYKNLKRKNGECYSILNSAEYHVKADGEESICLKGLDIIISAGTFFIEETYEEVYNLESFDKTFETLTEEALQRFLSRLKWMLAPLEKFLQTINQPSLL